MSETFNLYEAKNHLSKLVERAADGEEIIIAKSGKPKARLVPLQAVREPRRPGAWKGLTLTRSFGGGRIILVSGLGLSRK